MYLMSLVLMDQTRFKCIKHFKEILPLFNPSFLILLIETVSIKNISQKVVTKFYVYSRRT